MNITPAKRGPIDYDGVGDTLADSMTLGPVDMSLQNISSPRSDQIAPRSFEELANQQGVTPIDEIEALLGKPSRDDESAEEFSAMLRQWRPWGLSRWLVRNEGSDRWHRCGVDAFKGDTKALSYCVHVTWMVLLHGFVKKTQKTPAQDLRLALNRVKEVLWDDEEKER
jgi:hypothetical protein